MLSYVPSAFVGPFLLYHPYSYEPSASYEHRNLPYNFLRYYYEEEGEVMELEFELSRVVLGVELVLDSFFFFLDQAFMVNFELMVVEAIMYSQNLSHVSYCSYIL